MWQSYTPFVIPTWNSSLVVCSAHVLPNQFRLLLIPASVFLGLLLASPEDSQSMCERLGSEKLIFAGDFIVTVRMLRPKDREKHFLWIRIWEL